MAKFGQCICQNYVKISAFVLSKFCPFVCPSLVMFDVQIVSKCRICVFVQIRSICFVQSLSKNRWLCCPEVVYVFFQMWSISLSKVGQQFVILCCSNLVHLLYKCGSCCCPKLEATCMCVFLFVVFCVFFYYEGLGCLPYIYIYIWRSFIAYSGQPN